MIAIAVLRSFTRSYDRLRSNETIKNQTMRRLAVLNTTDLLDSVSRVFCLGFKAAFQKSVRRERIQEITVNMPGPSRQLNGKGWIIGFLSGKSEECDKWSVPMSLQSECSRATCQE